jgi:hypothetical protein
VTLETKTGEIPALVDAGAQFSRMRLDVAEYLFLTGERCAFSACEMNCALADGTRCGITDAVNLRVKLLGCTWDEDLPCLSLAFNTAIHESTGSTPDKLFLGREMKCPLGVRWDLTSLNKDSSTSTTQDFWTQAYRNLKRACSKVARRYNQDRIPHTYRVGDRVVFRLNLASSKAKQITQKMQLRWSPPMVIQRMVRPNVVLLANPDTGVVTRRAHVTQLKPCAERL